MTPQKQTPSEITTILCDLDGTLVDSSRDIAASFRRALRLVGETPPAMSRIARHIGKPLATMARDLGYCLPPGRLDRFLETYRRQYAARSAHWTRPYPGVESTLRRLASISLGIVTTKRQDQAERVLDQLDLIAYFRHIQGGSPDLRLKPAPDQIDAALAKLGGSPEQTLMVGDTVADIQAGKAAGVRTCAVTYGFGRVEDLHYHRPDHCIDSFPEILFIVWGQALII